MNRSPRLTRSAFLGRLAARPSALRLGQFDELDPMEELVALVERAEGDLAELSTEELTDLRAALATAYADIRPTVDNDEQVAALTTVVEALARVDGEATTREAAAAERETALAALDAAVNPPDAIPGEEGAGGDAGEGAPAGDGTPPAGSELANGEPPEGTPAAAPAEGTPAGEGAPAAGEPAAAPAQAAATPRRPPLSVLNRQRRTAEPEPHGDGDQSGETVVLAGRIVAAADLPSIGRTERFTTAEQLGAAMARMHSDSRVPDREVTTRKLYLGRATIADRSRVVMQSDFGTDESAIEAAILKNRALKHEDNRKVASGGVCAPPMPDYTITVVGDRGASWADSLPTVQGTRPIQFFPNINMSLRDAAGSRVGARPDGGIGFVTAAQDAGGYADPAPEGGHLPKDCVRIDCPSPVTSTPDAQFKCTTVGNFQAITFPEYVKAFDKTVGFYFDVERDESFLAKYVAAAKHLHASSGATFGAARDLLDVIRRLVAHVRSVRKVPAMPFQIDIPAFARYMIAQDLADSWSDGTSNMRITPAQALALLAVDEGITIGEYAVSIGLTANGSHTVLPELVTGTTLGAWPDQIRILAYPDGAIWRQDYGELAFGLRETGMSTNDFSGFYETLEQFNKRTTDLFTIDVDLCVNGAFGAAVEKVCVAVTSE